MFISDEDFERHTRAFADGTLPKILWSHEGHFAAALWLIRSNGLMWAEENMPDMIRRYNESVGGQNTDEEGYHHTITLASLRAADEFLRQRPEDESLAGCLNALMASRLGETRWLSQYWSNDSLMSVAARRDWVAPDLETPPWA